MREIKFRGKTFSGEWVYGNLAVLRQTIRNVECGTYISNDAGMPFAYRVIPETIGQYPGLKDKNGKEIYEDDIVKDEYNRVLLVKWRKCGFNFKAITKTNFVWAPDITQWFEYGFTHPEIIGNIHENPELLEDKES